MANEWGDEIAEEPEPGFGKVTSYGYRNDPYGDSATRAGKNAIGGKLTPGQSVAFSPDVEEGAGRAGGMIGRPGRGGVAAGGWAARGGRPGRGGGGASGGHYDWQPGAGGVRRWRVGHAVVG